MLDKAVYDRIMAALNFEEGDRVPIWDYIDNRAVYRYFAGDEPDYLKGMVKVYHGLGIDLCRGFGASFDESQEGQRGKNWMISGMTRWVTKRPINSLEDLNWNCSATPSTRLENTWSDIAYKDKLMVSPEFPRQTFIPCLRKVVEPLKEAGIKVIFHSDGSVILTFYDAIKRYGRYPIRL
ncbi:hypothetical protein J7M22_13800 [Candidatus Poribacteria bacterium]|nr:hypothetical protein [Candidatus Poribacteria bacterium]